MKKHLIQLGRFLYKYRAWIAVPFFILLVLFKRPGNIATIPYLLILVGLVIRFWAAGYIGKKARAAKFSTDCRITNGPYKYLEHPLYLGNFFLVLGIIMLFNPVIWFAIIVLIFFLSIYTIIILGEMDYLRGRPEIKEKFAFANCKGEVSTIGIVILILIIYQIIIRFRSL